jgi:hypothetical protein
MVATDGAEDRLGGFDRSFLVVMIRDFFVILLLVTVAEFALKAAMVVWEFDTAGRAATEDAAREVADNVRAIMVNEGGPVAARALYPIMQSGMESLGFLMAIEPSRVTIDSIQESFGFPPRGVQPPAWPEGRYVEGVVEIRAEAFCQTCHVRAQVGDVLGTVTVRHYLANDLAAWWKSLQITALLSLGKIVLHSVLLFLILKARMAPLLQLRDAVGGLSRAFGRLDRRVAVASRDEFGALSRDLNLFLERLQRVVAELDAVLRRVVAVNDDIVRIQTELRDRLDGFVAGVHRVERRAMLGARREPMLSAEWFDAMRDGVAALTLPGANVDPAAVAEKLRAVIAHAEAQVATNMQLFEDLAALGDDSERFRRDLSEMARLEERLQGVIETGTALLSRLQGPPPDPGAGGAVPAAA